MKRLTVSRSENIKEQIQLYFSGNDEAKYIHRLHALLLFTEKEAESCDSIGLLLGHSPRTISNWIKRINESGNIESLRSKKQSGRPSRLSEIQRQELRSVIVESPEKHGFTCNKWNGKSLSAYITAHYGIIMRTRTCQRLFHQLGGINHAQAGVSEEAQSGKKRKAPNPQNPIENEKH
ncbi:MAG: helix-turn-helix domain-containing protein [Treponema sp.]|jgi:transposase|nr:helix-turn-helix domain-containing protein [Treponema sp.]